MLMYLRFYPLRSGTSQKLWTSNFRHFGSVTNLKLLQLGQKLHFWIEKSGADYRQALEMTLLFFWKKWCRCSRVIVFAVLLYGTMWGQCLAVTDCILMILRGAKFCLHGCRRKNASNKSQQTLEEISKCMLNRLNGKWIDWNRDFACFSFKI